MQYKYLHIFYLLYIILLFLLLHEMMMLIMSESLYITLYNSIIVKLCTVVPPSSNLSIKWRFIHGTCACFSLMHLFCLACMYLGNELFTGCILCRRNVHQLQSAICPCFIPSDPELHPQHEVSALNSSLTLYNKQDIALEIFFRMHFFNAWFDLMIYCFKVIPITVCAIFTSVFVCFQYLGEVGTCSGEGSSFTPRDFCGFRTVSLSHTAGQSRTGAAHRGHQWATVLLLLLTFME